MTMIGSGWHKTVFIWKMEQHNFTLPFQLIRPHQFAQTTVMQSQNRQRWIEQLSLFSDPGLLDKTMCRERKCISGNICCQKNEYFLNYFFPFLCLRSILNSWAKRFISDFWFEKRRSSGKKPDDCILYTSRGVVKKLDILRSGWP